jgi:hypothetical protein
MLYRNSTQDRRCAARFDGRCSNSSRTLSSLLLYRTPRHIWAIGSALDFDLPARNGVRRRLGPCMHCLPLANRNVPRKVPEQGHGFRILGDILAAKGDAIKAEELHSLARAQYRSLGMRRWAETP